MFMVFFVLDDPNRLDDLLAAWTEAGVTGATIIESTGMRRRMAQRHPPRDAGPGAQAASTGAAAASALHTTTRLRPPRLAA